MSINRHQAVGAYQRWTPPAFDDNADAAEPAVVDSSVSPETATPPPEPLRPAEVHVEPPEPAVKLPTAQEVEAMFEQAREDGEKSGFQEGQARARAEVAQITKLVRAMDTALDQLGGDVANEIVELAIALARQMVSDTLEAHPEAVVGVVRQALQQVPQGKVRIHLNPEDIKLVRKHLDDQLETGHHHLVEDKAVARGGCRLEATGCDIDATLHTRWARVLSGIAHERKEPDDNA